MAEGKDRPEFKYSHGVLLGDKFWTFGGYYDGDAYRALIYSPKTTVWNTKRKLWMIGQDVPLYDCDSYYDQQNGENLWNSMSLWDLEARSFPHKYIKLSQRKGCHGYREIRHL